LFQLLFTLVEMRRRQRLRWQRCGRRLRLPSDDRILAYPAIVSINVCVFKVRDEYKEMTLCLVSYEDYNRTIIDYSV